MNASISIDIGGSTTKAVGFTQSGDLLGTLQIRAGDPRTSAFGALGRFMHEHSLSPADLTDITLTGLGSSFFSGDLLGIPTFRALELDAIGQGGLRLAGLKEALVVSMGTGTAFVRAGESGCVHLGGSGIGGGTLSGLASRFLHQTEIPALAEMAGRGDRAMADLRISDLLDAEIPALNSELTAANFGKIKSNASDEDMAAALFNMIYENIGVMAVFALAGDAVRDVVLTGSLACLSPARTTFDVFNRMQDIFHVNFIIPPHAAFATAVGAWSATDRKHPTKQNHTHGL